MKDAIGTLDMDVLEKEKSKSPSLLVIAYLRPDNLRQILASAVSAGIKVFYISVDYPKNRNQKEMYLHSEVIRVVEEFQTSTKDLQVIINLRKRNIGCSASVLSSCDWFFSKVEFGIVLEDDCIPHETFFDFVADSFVHLDSDPDVWLTCGTQFAPKEIAFDWQKSRYALTWGWATTNTKWDAISGAIRDGNFERIDNANISFFERTYWNAGARRAIGGMSDAWDTPLVQRMLALGKFSIIPSVSLVMNTGNDSVATHTFGNSAGIRMQLGTYVRNNHRPIINTELDDWISKHHYKIRVRHVISTRITYLIDRFRISRLKSKPLVSTWDESAILS